VLSGQHDLAQLWFRSEVLDKYLGADGYKTVRTNSVGRVRGPQWMVDFGIAGEGDDLVHLSVREAARIPETERAHWSAHAAGMPVSANYVTMQLTRGACIDDGDVRAWVNGRETGNGSGH
jgi:hypothetical protein